MEGGELLYVVFLVLYGIYSIFSGGKKKKDKAAPPLQPPVTPTKKKKKRRRHQPQPAVQENEPVVVSKNTNQRRQKDPNELKRQIEARVKRMQEMKKREDLIRPNSDSDSQDNRPIFKEEYIPEQVQESKYFDYDHQKIERHNLDDSPKTHKDDAHYNKRKRKKGIKIGRDFKFNVKHAIIYKEVMERKYFKI